MMVTCDVSLSPSNVAVMGTDGQGSTTFEVCALFSSGLYMVQTVYGRVETM